MRIKLMAMLGNVRIPLQVDVGAGDAVVPPPEILDFPGLLDLPRARLRAYRPETSIAEKTEAMVRLALANSRMKDFFDIHRLVETRTFDGETMRLAVTATFTRRGVDIPIERPLALSVRHIFHQRAVAHQEHVHVAPLPPRLVVDRKRCLRAHRFVQRREERARRRDNRRRRDARLRDRE